MLNAYYMIINIVPVIWNPIERRSTKLNISPLQISHWLITITRRKKRKERKDISVLS